MKAADAIALLTLLFMVVATILGGITLGVGIWFGEPLSFEVM